MIDEKRLEQISKYGFVMEGVGEETFEILRLVRVGMWAEKHGVPAIEHLKTSIQSIFLVAQEAHMALPKAKLVSMGMSDFRALRELGLAIDHLHRKAVVVDAALAAIPKENK